MRTSRTMFLLCSGVAFYAFGQPAPAQPVETAVHTVQQARPLEEVVHLLIREYGLSVNYEEPMVVHADDIVDQSIKRDNSALGQRGGTFRFTVNRSGRNLPDARAALESIVQQYNASGLTGRFQVKPAGPLLSITPLSVKDRFGVLALTQSPLDAPLKIAEQRLEGPAMVRLFCEMLTQASGVKVYPGVLPPTLIQGFTTIRADGEEARLVLARALGTLERKEARIQIPIPGFRWLLYYSIRDNAFVLHLASFHHSRSQSTGGNPRFR